MVDPRRTMTVSCKSGLCNRLKVLLSGIALAEASGRDFSMVWEVRDSCGAGFSDLFQSRWVIHPAPLNLRGREIDLIAAAWDCMPDILALEDRDLLVTYHDWLIRPARYSHHKPLVARCAQLLNDLSPASEICKRIESLRASLFRDQMIGVHLRRGDFVASRPDVASNLAPTLALLDKWLDELPDAGILLCTDDGADTWNSNAPQPSEGIVAQFETRYGGRVARTRPRTLNRRESGAIQDAVADLWLLRATDRFIGTAGSSFSELAMYGRTVPAVLTAGPTPQYARENRWLTRTGVARVVSRLARHEFGEDMPYTMLRWRYRERLDRWRASLRARR
jgi:hypothetical protein